MKLFQVNFKGLQKELTHPIHATWLYQKQPELHSQLLLLLPRGYPWKLHILISVTNKEWISKSHFQGNVLASPIPTTYLYI